MADDIIHKFRNAALGFNRQDVLDYITRTDGEWRKRLTKAEKERDDLRGERDELSQSVRRLEGENSEAGAENSRVRAALEESTRTLTQMREKLNAAEDELIRARKELSELRNQVAELEAAAQSYADLKDRVAVIELEAHQKAQATTDEAEEHARRVREETQRWLADKLEQYEALRGCAGELDQRLQELGSMAARLGAADETAAHLLREAGQAVPVDVPEDAPEDAP